MRDRYAGLYDAGFADIQELTRPRVEPHVQHAWHLYVIQLDLDRLCIGRNEFIEQLQQHDIGCSVHFIPLHLHPYYRETWGYVPSQFPVAGAMYETIVSLPLYPKMTETDVQRVITVVRDLIQRYRR